MHMIKTSSFPFGTRVLGLAVGLCMTACTQSPHAAVPPDGMAAGAAPAEMDAAAVPGCADGGPLQRAVSALRAELQPQGLALRAVCEAPAQSLVVQVEVRDGVRASKVVRGPLADGEPVDMGMRPGGAAATAAADTDVSPDVQHNRQWLRGVMARHQFHQLPEAGWHFAQKAAPRPVGGELDLAAR